MQNTKIVYNVIDIITMLEIDKNTAYALVKSNEFPVKRVGTKYIIPAKTFDEWLYSKTS